ncbi:sensor histidine kinase [Alkalimarinus alittae]|uniref:histidine kinase n=1 Tax=Alkalimarinus alittae TaxID=2961619 RepID=A0ABY6N1Z5_9ALTE|nr:ATP-binding protein [Alkalimarinus alittae]UZE96032.1 ATP-binding protein [Alkalimarinus alittae]
MTVGIRGKLLLITGTIVFIALVILTSIQVSLQREAFEEELHKRTALMKENLYQQATFQAETLERFVTENIASYNLLALTYSVQQAAQENQDLEYVVILDDNNKVYVHTADESQQLETFVPPEGWSSAKTTTTDKGHAITLIGKQNSESLMAFRVPLQIGSSKWGNMLLVYSLARLNDQVALSQQENEQRLSSLTLRTYFLGLAVLIVAYFLISQLSLRLVAPILSLSRFAKDLSEGDFSNTDKITSNAKDEVGALTRNFAHMAIRVEQSRRQQAEYNQTLEKEVNQRTNELNLKNDELTKALDGLEESQQQLIHSEKMAALGQLVAGIAHEINTPLGAIKASVGNTSKYLSLFIDGFSVFLMGANNDDKALLRDLLTHARHERVSSTREERKIKRRLITILDEHQINRSDEVADMLVDMELSDHLPRMLPALSQPSAFKVVELAHRLTGVGRNSETVRTAIGRASKVVFALKNFAHHDNTGHMISSDINLGIQTVLVLYQSLLKQECEVVEDFGELPMILCYPDELNQVWTNLIHNALYAMENSGRLIISTLSDGENIQVIITDNGCGIPEDIQSKIYESFFTTKPAGEGSGLGLGICKRIIDKHQGSIEFISRPGKTRFVVTLPINQ